MRRLLNTVRRHEAIFDGWCLATLGSMDPLLLPLDRYLNLIYYWLTKDADQDWITKMENRLWMPPKGVAPTRGSPWSAEAETAAFRGFVAQVKGASSTPASGER